jgi:predicted nuclease of predicted toxin-antitoxin system
MNLLADESVDRQIVERLREDGHDVLYIAEVEPSISDNVVFDRANEKFALLVTGDKDFGEIVFRDNRLSSGGVVLLRLVGLYAEKKAEIVSDAFREHEADFANHFSVVAPGKIRTRPKEAT